jgi:hypothetical protein
MTTVVATYSIEFATMYADEGITGDYIHPDMNKIHRQGSWLIGVCGEDRVCDILQYVVKYPEPPRYLLKKPDEEWFAWIATRVIPVISKAIEKSMHKSYWGTIGDSEVLLVTHGRAFLIGETLGVTRAHPYWSVGSGSAVALGSLASTVASKDWMSYHDKYARKSIVTAQKHDPYTRGKISGYRSYPNGAIEEAV